MRHFVLASLLVAAGALNPIEALEAPTQSTNKEVQQSASTSSSKINLNTADRPVLESLPGIGPRTAQLIIEYRTETGGFKKVEELMNVKGIGEKTFLRLRELVHAETEEGGRWRVYWRAESTWPLRLPARAQRRCSTQMGIADGVSFVELMLCLGAVTLLVGMAGPAVLAMRDDVAARAAVRYVASEAMLARFQATRRGAAVGIRFERISTGYQFTSYVDGNGDGIRAADIARGVDRMLQPAQSLRDRFPSVGFALAANVPPIAGKQVAGSEFQPIRLGSGNTLTFSPVGTATSGSLYLRGRSGQQYAIRILGTTGRLRVLHFDAQRGSWQDR